MSTPLLLLYAELVDEVMRVGLIGSDGGVIPSGKVLLVGGVGINLRFKAEGCALLIGDAVLTRDGAVEEIADINLETWLVGEDLKFDAGDWRNNAGSKLIDGLIGGEHPVVVIAVAVV